MLMGIVLLCFPSCHRPVLYSYLLFDLRILLCIIEKGRFLRQGCHQIREIREMKKNQGILFSIRENHEKRKIF